MAEMKIKSWKAGQIMRDMSHYGDKFFVDIKGSEMGHYFKEYEDEAGYVTVTNVFEIKRETEKALLLNIGGFDAWVPKSAVCKVEMIVA